MTSSVDALPLPLGEGGGEGLRPGGDEGEDAVGHDERIQGKALGEQ
jgi:hypothetical protein